MLDRIPTLPLPPVPDPNWAWFFDIDGTLIELAQEPASLKIKHRLPEILAALQRQLGGALALVSGRSIENILQLIAPFRLPLAGCHGIERRLADGRILRPEPSPDMDRARRIFSDFTKAHDGLFLEDKGLTLALHFRQAPHLEADCQAVAEQAAVGDLNWFPGKMVFEVMARNYTKGSAVEAFMAEEPFRGRKPVFIGDDLPDEDGFETVRRLGGLGILIGPMRSTKAQFRLDSVSALHAWLAKLPL
jgi:trehalose 6-phosphate phosphatase